MKPIDSDYCLVTASEADYRSLRDIWETAVRASHDFLAETDIKRYRSRLIRDYFSAVEIIAAKTPDGQLVGFMGLSGNRIEMLFIRPTHHRQGIGRRLLDEALRRNRPIYLDVNEQNSSARAFYQRYGFVAIGRDDVDGDGNPFPIIHMACE